MNDITGSGERERLSAGAPRLPFVGRTNEKRELVGSLDESLHGRGALFIISGEPGIGKTRLAQEVAFEAEARGARVAWGTSWEGGGAPPYWLWMQVLRTVVSEFQIDASELPEREAPYLQTLLPELLAGVERAKPSPRGPLSSEQVTSGRAEEERFRLFDAVVAFLKRVSSRAALFIVLDDIHVADLESVSLLYFLSRSLQRTRIMIVATYRQTDVRLSGRPEELLSRLAREATIIALRGLSRVEVAQFVALRLGIDGIADALHDATDGNPFFLTEIAQLLAVEGRDNLTPIGSVRIPDTIRASIHRSLESVSDQAREILRLGSVIGREFDWVILQKVSGIASDQLLSTLDQLARVGLLEELSGAMTRYRFSHALISEAVRNEIPALQRRELHLRVAQGIEQLQVLTRDSNVYLSELAHHYLQSLPLVPPEQPALYAARAADCAMSSFAYIEAARLCRTALDVVGSTGAIDPALRCELLLNQAKAQCWSGEYVGFRDIFKEASEIARTLNRPDLLAQAILGYATLGSEAGTTDQFTVRLLQQALAAIGFDNDALKAMLLARLADEIRWSAVPAEVAAVARQALEVAEKAGDPVAMLAVLAMRYDLSRNPDGSPDEWLSLTADAVRLADEHHLHKETLRARYHRASVLLELGDIAGSYVELDAINQIPEGARHGWQYAGFTEMMNATRALIEGRLGDAERLATEALDAAKLRPQSIPRQIFTVQIFAVRHQQGRLVELLPTLENLATRFTELPALRCLLALCYCGTGSLARARVLFDSLAADDFRAIHRNLTWMLAMACTTETCAALSDASRAEILYRLLVPYCSRNVSIGYFCYLGPVAYYLGRLAATMGNPVDAERHFEEAMNMALKSGAGPWLARTEYSLAGVLLSKEIATDVQRGRALHQEARLLASQLGLIALVKRIDALQSGEVGVEPAVTPGPFPAAWVLSPGEERQGSRRLLASILFIDIVGSTARIAELTDRGWVDLRRRFFAAMRRELENFGGSEIGTYGDGMLAVFQQPSAAVNSAMAMTKRAAELGLQVRCGVHMGECEFVGDDIVGIAVHLCARIASCAGPSEVLVSSTVREVLSGGQIEFVDRGLHDLKGIPEEWRLYAVQS